MWQTRDDPEHWPPVDQLQALGAAWPASWDRLLAVAAQLKAQGVRGREAYRTARWAGYTQREAATIAAAIRKGKV